MSTLDFDVALQLTYETVYESLPQRSGYVQFFRQAATVIADAQAQFLIDANLDNNPPVGIDIGIEQQDRVVGVIKDVAEYCLAVLSASAELVCC